MTANALTRIDSTNQIISAFGNKTDAISLVRNLGEGLTSGERAKVIGAVTE